MRPAWFVKANLLCTTHFLSMCVRYMRYGSVGDLAILKNVKILFLYGDSKSCLPFSLKIILSGCICSKVFVFCVLVKYLSKPGFCYGLWRSATLSETVCVGRIQTIPETKDMCPHLLKRSWRFKMDRWQFLFVAQKNYKN